MKNTTRISIYNNNIIVIGEWNDDWILSNKDTCLTNSHNFILIAQYPDNIANWLSNLTSVPSVTYRDGKFIIYSSNPSINIAMFLREFYKCSNIPHETPISFYYYNQHIDNGSSIDFIISRLRYSSNNYCSIQ